MPRARFERLDPAQQDLILTAALREFAAHGFADASLNRIISAAALSKGAMYYYFDDKADLYLHVVTTQVGRLAGDPADLTFLREATADGFWSALAADSIRMLTRLSELPEVAAVLRDAAGGSGATVLGRGRQKLDAATDPWVVKGIRRGQQLGAVRSDLPVGLLAAVAGAMMQAMDAWYLAQRDVAAPDLQVVREFIGMLRRSLQP